MSPIPALTSNFAHFQAHDDQLLRLGLLAEVELYKPDTSKIELSQAPDEIRVEVEGFNRKVITEPFNRVVCEYLATEIDPSSPQKTLIFCATDAHADLVVKLLKDAFTKQYVSVEDDAVIKITGTADKPLGLILRYKNEKNPSVAVTVDLLTTGIDVPSICNIVFLRRHPPPGTHPQATPRASIRVGQGRLHRGQPFRRVEADDQSGNGRQHHRLHPASCHRRPADPIHPAR